MSTAQAHHDLSPSKFPAWAACPCFESDPTERDDATAGTAQHTALSCALAGNTGPLLELPADSREAVQWAEGYIRQLAGESPILSEHRLSYSAPDAFAPRGTSEVFFGTADAIIIHPPGNLADLIDFKSGADDRDHRAQLAGYALALFTTRTRLKTIRCHVLYGRTRRADAWSLTEADAAGTVLPILEARRNPARQPAACDYCTFCASRATCPALIERVELVAAEVPDWKALAPAIRDPASITDPSVAAKALTLARFVSTWSDAVRARATEMAKAGKTLPGYRLQERRTAREVSDMPAALARSGLTAEQFVTACKLSVPRLGEVTAAARGLSKAAGAREVEAALGELIADGTPTVALVADRKA